MKMITNLWKPTSGTIEVFGEVLTPKSYEVFKKNGKYHRVSHLYDHMTGRENLQLHQSIWAITMLTVLKVRCKCWT